MMMMMYSLAAELPIGDSGIKSIITRTQSNASQSQPSVPIPMKQILTADVSPYQHTHNTFIMYVHILWFHWEIPKVSDKKRTYKKTSIKSISR